MSPMWCPTRLELISHLAALFCLRWYLSTLGENTLSAAWKNGLSHNGTHYLYLLTQHWENLRDTTRNTYNFFSHCFRKGISAQFRPLTDGVIKGTWRERKQKERDWLWCNKLRQRWEEGQASWHCLKCVPWPLTDNVHYMCIVYRICCLLLRKVQSYKLKTDFTTKRTTKWQILVTWNHPTFCIKQTDM